MSLHSCALRRKEVVEWSMDQLLQGELGNQRQIGVETDMKLTKCRSRNEWWRKKCRWSEHSSRKGLGEGQEKEISCQVKTSIECLSFHLKQQGVGVPEYLCSSANDHALTEWK